MTAGIKEKQDVYLESFSELEKRSPGPAWLERIRKDAILRFADLGFPTTRIEAWKYTNVSPIASLAFEPAAYAFNTEIEEQFKRSPFANLECSRVVFVNGHYCPELSLLEAPEGVKAGSLASALRGPASSLEAHLARHAKTEKNGFVALNTAFINDGAYVEIPNGAVLEKPILLVFLSVAGSRPAVSFPRNLIVLGRHAQATLIEGYVGLGDAAYFTNAVTEIVAGENAIVNYCKVQRESDAAFHIASVHGQLERSSTLHTHSFAFGALLDREDVDAVLAGEGAECLLNGLYVTTGRQHVDNCTTLDHAKPHCSSRELYKGILDGASSGVFNGRIVVRKDAQKTDSKQSNKNLLLSEKAVINTKPQLEIYADDVKCTHGATIGQIDPDAVFYLRSRGISLREARNLLTYAFANDVIGRIPYAPLRERLKDELFARLGGGARTEGI